MKDTGHRWFSKDELAGSPVPIAEPYCALCGAYYGQAFDKECPNRRPEPEMITIDAGPIIKANLTDSLRRQGINCDELEKKVFPIPEHIKKIMRGKPKPPAR